MDYVPTVHVKQWKLGSGGSWVTWCNNCPYVTPYTYTVSPPVSALGGLAASNPGILWLIGNEIERRDWDTGGQDEIVPELYAQVYHEVYTAIKSADPTAQVAIGSMVEATPLRLQYLERVWSEYSRLYSSAMPVDVWNLHIFILPEQLGGWGAGIPAGLSDTTGTIYGVLDHKNFALAWDQIVAYRTWMKDHGQRDKPLYLTEYGVIFPDWSYPGQFTPEQVRDSYMYPSFNYFLNENNATVGFPADGNRLVQRWIWYSLDDDSRGINYGVYRQNYNGNLFSTGYETQPMGLSTLGIYWQQYVQALPLNPNVPYASAARLSQSQATPAVVRPQPEPPARVDCGDSQAIRLLFYERSARFSIVGTGTTAPPRVAREAMICLDRAAP
jgi:hypothetical protein